MEALRIFPERFTGFVLTLLKDAWKKRSYVFIKFGHKRLLNKEYFFKKRPRRVKEGSQNIGTELKFCLKLLTHWKVPVFAVIFSKVLKSFSVCQSLNFKNIDCSECCYWPSNVVVLPHFKTKVTKQCFFSAPSPLSLSLSLSFVLSLSFPLSHSLFLSFSHSLSFSLSLFREERIVERERRNPFYLQKIPFSFSLSLFVSLLPFLSPKFNLGPFFFFLLLYPIFFYLSWIILK